MTLPNADDIKIPEPDVIVSNEGTVWLFELQSEAARTWVDENVQTEGYQWLGGLAFAVDWRFAKDLLLGMMAAGLRIGGSKPGGGKF